MEAALVAGALDGVTVESGTSDDRVVDGSTVESTEGAGVLVGSPPVTSTTDVLRPVTDPTGGASMRIADASGRINVPRVVAIRSSDTFRGDDWIGLRLREASVVRGIGVLPIFAGAVGLLLDRALFRPLRQHGTQIVLVIASFGASLALRYGLAFLYGPEPAYYTRDIQLAAPIVPGLPAVRATPNQLFVLGLTAVLVVGLHLLLTRTTLGRAMRAVSENPTLARVVGVDPETVARWTWLIGGALATIAGVFVGLTVQIRPWLGFDLLLPLFAATILGGVGSVYGAVLGGLLIGLAEAFAVPLVGAEYRAAVAFTVLLAVLLVRPRGLLGTRE